MDFCFATLQFPSSSRTSLESNEGKEKGGLGVKLGTSVCFQGLFMKVEDKGRPKKKTQLTAAETGVRNWEKIGNIDIKNGKKSWQPWCYGNNGRSRKVKEKF